MEPYNPLFHIRNNCFAGMYCQIAMESYYEANENYCAIKENNYSIYEDEKLQIMDRKAIICIVFSAMCIESFLNDFAATSLGDAEFYDNFDKLSTISKFQLIAKFILNEEVDKSKAYYSYLKKLFRLRDSYVHNKSTESNFHGYSREEFNEIMASINVDEEIADLDNCQLPISDVDNVMRDALDGLKAIYSLALFFDQRKSGANAVSRLFCPFNLYCGTREQKECLKFVYSKIGLKVDENYEISI